MRLVFLGTPAAAVPSLQALAQAGHDIALVVTRPDRPVGRSGRLQPPPVKVAAKAAGLETFQPSRVRGTVFLERLALASPEILIVVAYGKILGRRVLELPERGAVNLHFSLLPRYRGAAPVAWALARGEESTGVTTMLINERMDEGDLLLQGKVTIEDGERAPELEKRLSGIGARLLVETLDRLGAGTLEPRPQDPALATYAPLLSPRDGEFEPRLDAAEIEGRVRGFEPWPGVWAYRGGRRLRLAEARRLPDRNCSEPPGTLVELAGGGLVMACAGGTALLISQVQPEGGRSIGARDAVNGRHLQLGDRLEGPQSS